MRAGLLMKGGWFQMVHPGLVKYYQSTGLPHCLSEPVIHRNYPTLFHLSPSLFPFSFPSEEWIMGGVSYSACKKHC